MAAKGNILIVKDACSRLIVSINTTRMSVDNSVDRIVKICNEMIEAKAIRGKTGAEIMQNFQVMVQKYGNLRQSIDKVSTTMNAKLTAFIAIAEQQEAKNRNTQDAIAQQNLGVYKE